MSCDAVSLLPWSITHVGALSDVFKAKISYPWYRGMSRFCCIVGR